MDKALTDAVMHTLRHRLEGRQLICGICGGTRWSANNGITNLPVQDNFGNSLVIGGKMMPIIGLICDVCGNTQFINLIRLIGKDKLDEITQQAKVEKEVGKMVNEALKEET